jgi:hypothetical protein
MIGRLTSTAEVVGENGKGVCDLIAPEPSLCLNLRNDRYTCSHVFRNVPLGYDASERPLVISPSGAETVRRISRTIVSSAACVVSTRRPIASGFGRNAGRR